MNGHDKRRQRIIDRIKTTALELFSAYGVDKVSVDEVAAKAEVSKVTIYKYFHSKEELHRDVFKQYFNEVLAAAEKILDSDLDFIEKFKIVLGTKAIFPKVADNPTFFELLEKENQNEAAGKESPKNRIRAIMYRFFEQGKKEGYIEAGLSFEMLYLYYEIVQAGYKAKSIDFDMVLADPRALDQLLDLFYFGFILRK